MVERGEWATGKRGRVKVLWVEEAAINQEIKGLRGGSRGTGSSGVFSLET